MCFLFLSPHPNVLKEGSDLYIQYIFLELILSSWYIYRDVIFDFLKIIET